MIKDMLNLDFNKTIDTSLPTISISNCLGFLNKPFDSDLIAEKTYNKNFNNPASKYYQKTIEEIKEMWAQKGAISCQYGSMVDDYIGIKLTGTKDDLELFNLDNDIEGDGRLYNSCSSIDLFFNQFDKNWEFVNREQTLYLPLKDNNGTTIAYVKGRFDALFRHKITGKYLIIDWKTTENITYSNKYEKLLGPCKMLDACDLNTYTLQGYFYKTALLENYVDVESEDDVQFMIVQFPGRTFEDEIKYNTHNPGFIYNKNFMYKFFDYAFKKKQLLDKKNEQ